MKQSSGEVYLTFTEQPVDSQYPPLLPVVQQQLSFGGIALGTLIGMTVLIREIRLLVQACK